jgi:hypothetical protein
MENGNGSFAAPNFYIIRFSVAFAARDGLGVIRTFQIDTPHNFPCIVKNIHSIFEHSWLTNRFYYVSIT